MFTGLVEAQAQVRILRSGNQTLTLAVAFPTEFNDVKRGDSIALNGVCLTVENVDSQEIQFTLGAETLHLLGGLAEVEKKLKLPVNLERSALMGQRNHGHDVSGHIECVGKVILSEAEGECWRLRIELSPVFIPFVLRKGSVAVHGVSLTVNAVLENSFDVCLIPETIIRTNLSLLRPGDSVWIETDQKVKNIFSWFQKEEVLQFVTSQIQKRILEKENSSPSPSSAETEKQ